jgi:phytoene synthase
MSARDPVVSEARAVLAAHARTFHLAGMFLPPGSLDDAAIIYALCRLVDDTIDEAAAPAEGAAGLAVIEAELRGEAAPRPLIAATLAVAERRGIAIAVILELCAGVRSDASEVRIADDAALIRYCYQVAGTVGLMMCGVMGVAEAVALPFALDLGIAMQITNICRDVAEDAGRGRIYVPASRLQAGGVAPESLLDGSVDRAALAPIIDDLLGLAERYYTSAEQGMRWIPGRSRLAILVASRVYRAIGRRLGRRGSDPMRGRTVVPLPTKIGLVAMALLVFVGRARPLGGRPIHDPWLHRLICAAPGVDPRARALVGRLGAA